MTPEQLEKANQLNKKIAQSEKHLAFMKDALKLSTENNVPISLFTVDLNGGIGNTKSIKFSPNFIEDTAVKADVIQLLQSSTAGLIALFEYDLQLMKLELSNL